MVLLRARELLLLAHVDNVWTTSNRLAYDPLAFFGIVNVPEDNAVVKRCRCHVITLSDIEAKDVSSVSTVNFLFANDLTSLVFQWSLEEGNFAIPECGGDPVVCLLVKEGEV